MAAPRNLAIGALGLVVRNGISEATYWANRDVNRPFAILGVSI
jgi:hypothetical protein